MRKILFLLILLLSTKLMAVPLEVAITFDDLPMQMNNPSGETRLAVAKKILATLEKHGIKNVYGFINADQITDANSYEVLKLWVNSGQLLGNHTYGHMNLNSFNAQKFNHQIQMNDSYLTTLMKDKDFHYFRYPYLHEGNTEAKRDAVRKYLFDHNYQIAQVTMDFSDYLWNNPYRRCVRKGDTKAVEWLKKSFIAEGVSSIKLTQELSNLVFHHDIKNILLLHFVPFDALMLDDLLTAYEKNGVKFISLSDALKDKVYQVNPDYVSNETDIFPTQILHVKKMHVSRELNLLLTRIPENKLKHLCR